MADWADVYLADLWVWNGLDRVGRPGGALKPRTPPPSRPEADNVVPTVGVPSSWSSNIDGIINGLKPDQTIANLMMMGHGEAGRFTIGAEIKYDNPAVIAQFERLRPFTNPAITHAYIFGCEVAADGPCEVKVVNYIENGLRKTGPACVGQFSGSTGKPGYFLLSQLADAMNAPVTACTWKLPIDGGWQVGPDWQTVPLLTVGPGGAWIFRDYTGSVRYGSPRKFGLLGRMRNNLP
jgi:hypothetical protein